MSYVLYVIPVVAFGITVCLVAVAFGTTREELDEDALRQDISRRYGDGEV